VSLTFPTNYDTLIVQGNPIPEPLPGKFHVLDYPIVAIGDLHGRREWLQLLIAKLRTHIAWPTAKLVFLGDLVDRGDDVRGLVELVMELLDEKPGSVCLTGNHDFAFVKAASLDDTHSEYWPTHYGKHYDHQATFQSYLGRSPEYQSDGDWQNDLKLIRDAIPTTHREFLANLPWMAESSGHVFVHNGLSPYLEEPAEIQLDLLRRKRWHGYVTPILGTATHHRYKPEYPVWLGADKTLSSNPLPALHKVIVSGHVMVDAPDVNSTRIRIDTSGGVRPPLTACVLTAPTEMEFVFSE
jgi:serine/threonine protein phosphatase 1